MVILIFILDRTDTISARRLQLNPFRRRPHWAELPLLTRYYGGLRSLVPRYQNVPEYPSPRGDDSPSTDNANPPHVRRDGLLVSSGPFSPYPDYASAEYSSEYSTVEDCFTNTSLNASIPSVRAYEGVPQGFPDAAMGSYEVLGLRDDICFERFGRLGPYGLGYSIRDGGTGAGLHGDRDGFEDVWGDNAPVDFKTVKWAQLQERCLALNAHRFHADEETTTEARDARMERGSSRRERSRTTNRAASGNAAKTSIRQSSQESNETYGVLSRKPLARTAFLIRTWNTYSYGQEDILFLRSLITELSLLSGGEYTIHMLVHVKDDDLQIWSDQETYQRVLRESLPEEFWGLGTLWTERQMKLFYGGLEPTVALHYPVYDVFRSTFLPVQWFALRHPEYDYFWHWEMDARYTGHYYNLVDKVTKWAKKQPRKGLWERNGRYYVPSVHGSWEDFKQMVRVQTEMGARSAGRNGRFRLSNKGDRPIWGPERPLPKSDQSPPELDYIPATTYEKDKDQLGVGEEADLISLNPVFDPDGTDWALKNDVTGYNMSQGLPPRRASIVTVSRLSRRLLRTMHYEVAMKRHLMFSEMWPASCALHHGYKAVYAPHPMYLDRNWPTALVDTTFNGGRNGAVGGARTSVFGAREHNFKGTTWFYNAAFPNILWRRWLGLRVGDEGGEEFELTQEGRMCLPGVLLHPVKEVNLTIEGSEGNSH